MKTTPLYGAGRFVMHRLRELKLYAGMRRPGLRMAVLPSTGREMSSLLRGYNVAEELAGRGWNTLVLPAQLEAVQRRRVLRRFRPDIALLLGSRHRDNSAALLQGIPFLYDLDDADFHDPRLVERIRIDVRAAAGVIAGSAYVEAWCRELNPRTKVIWTGSPEPSGDFPPQTARGPLVTWAQSAPFNYPAELGFVTDVLCALEAPAFTFRLYGCKPEHADHPAVERIRAQGVRVELMPFMPYADFLASLDEVAVGLSPVIPDSPFSRGKSFGKILAYLSAGVAIIASDEVDHGRFFRPATGVISNDPAVWTRETAALLADPARREAMAQAAFSDFRDRLSTRAACTQVETFAHEVLGR